MADLLLELFSEEIPAGRQDREVFYLQDSLEDALKINQSQSFVTPRRLSVIIKNLPVTQPDVTTELKGPRVDAPEAALNGFLKKNNLSLEQLENRSGVYFATIHQKGKPTAEILKQAIEEILAKFPWQKSMRWGSGSTAWVRPLHSILCIFNDKIVPVEFAGIKAGNITYGHRFLAPEAITISSPDEYAAKLEKAFVIADRGKRKADILKQATDAANSRKLTLKEDISLLEEVTGLVECPNVLVGKIDDKFMDLPPEVLTMVMRSHQKYFALQNPDGSLSSNFLITSNMKTEDGGAAIISGNERVLRARFADARFFWDTDRGKPLTEWAEGLKTVTYHAKLGSIADKVERVKSLALALAEYVPNSDKSLVARAADLCKADLVSGMVGEFAELQGIMGRYYAASQGEPQPVADAIREHYKPAGASDIVPTAPISICLALADKLDTLISMFAIGEKPTGSKDPFALRRAALGVIRILLENGIRLQLSKISNGELLAFFHDRLKVMLKEQDIRHDVISAVTSEGDDDLVRVVARARAVQEFLESADGKDLLAAYKRAANIVNAEEKKYKTRYSGLVKAGILEKPEEKTLAELLEKTAGELEALKAGEKFVEAMQKLSGLRAPLDDFFDKIMVNCEDKNLRAERLHLLARLRSVMNSIANFALIEG